MEENGEFFELVVIAPFIWADHDNFILKDALRNFL